MIPTILVATGNEHKMREFRLIADTLGISLISVNDVIQQRPELSMAPEVEEIGVTFLENARLKAEGFLQWSKMPCLADDSGIEIDDLDKRPGVFSARYAMDSETPNPTDEENYQKVLSELTVLEEQGVDLERHARFRCALVLRFPDGREYVADASLEGQVLCEPRGSGGFGYDPIIEIEGTGKTFAEMADEQKCKCSARGQAARSLFSQLV